jgi:hypothetical protein
VQQAMFQEEKDTMQQTIKSMNFVTEENKKLSIDHAKMGNESRKAVDEMLKAKVELDNLRAMHSINTDKLLRMN